MKEDYDNFNDYIELDNRTLISTILELETDDEIVNRYSRDWNDEYVDISKVIEY